jgi:hypothetical protein
MRFVKVIRNTAIGIVALLMLTVGGGVAYTWYVGEYGTEVAPVTVTPPQAAPTAPSMTRVKPAPDAVVSASIQMLTSPVAPGENSSVTVRTIPDAKCKITVMYGEVASQDSGLVAKTADEYGMVSWAWTVEESVPLGEWPVEVTCANAKNSAVVKGDLIVANAE